MKRQLTSNFWENYSKTYDFLSSSIAYTELIKDIGTSISPLQDCKLLDIGCGTGNFLAFVADKDAVLYGIDNSVVALSIAKNKVPKATFIQVNINEKLPFNEKTFDRIVCNNVLYSLSKMERGHVMLEILRILKPGGKVVVSDPKNNFNSLIVFFYSVKMLYRQRGLTYTFKYILFQLVNIYRLFYYNRIIDMHVRVNPHIKDVLDQESILYKAGFIVRRSFLSYAKQNIVTIATK